MKTSFLFVCLIVLASVSFSQTNTKDFNHSSAQNELSANNLYTGLHGKHTSFQKSYINGNATVINMEETYKASYYADMVKGEYDFVINALQKQEVGDCNPMNRFVKKMIINN